MPPKSKPPYQNYDSRDNSLSAFHRTTAFIAVGALIASGVLIATSCNKQKGGDGSSEAETTTSYVTKVETTTAATTTVTEKPLVLLPDAETELTKNDDAAGWMTIKNLVDEPIVQCEDNEFYLNRGYNKASNGAGTVFADYRNVLDGSKQSDNIVLYGHSQKDGSRFGALQKTRWNIAGFKTNQTMYMRTNYEERQFKLYAIFLTNVLPKHDNGVVFNYHNELNFETEEAFDNFKGEVDKRNMIKTDTDYIYGDKIVTLSTCAYDFEESRYVFIYRQVREDEDPEPSSEAFSIVSDPYMPACIYGYNGNYKNR